MFQDDPCEMGNISQKCHENPFILFTAMLLTDMLPPLDGRLCNSLIRHETIYLIISFVMTDISWKISWKSVYLFYHDITNKERSMKWKINPDFEGFTTTSQKCPRLFLASCPTVIFHENLFICFPVMLLRAKDFRANIEKETLYLKGGTYHPNPEHPSPNFSDYSLYHLPPILKFSWKSVFE